MAGYYNLDNMAAGPLAGYLQGRQGAMLEEEANFKRQQDAEKQASDIETQRMAKQAYAAQVAAMQDRIKADQEARATERANQMVGYMGGLQGNSPEFMATRQAFLENPNVPDSVKAVLGREFTPEQAQGWYGTTDTGKNVTALRKQQEASAGGVAKAQVGAGASNYRADQALAGVKYAADARLAAARLSNQIKVHLASNKPMSTDQLLADSLPALTRLTRAYEDAEGLEDKKAIKAQLDDLSRTIINATATLAARAKTPVGPSVTPQGEITTAPKAVVESPKLDTGNVVDVGDFFKNRKK